MENEIVFQKNIEYFTALLDRFPESNFEALHYSSGESQVIRFIVLSQISNLKEKSVLDLGCGFGDFGYYLKKDGKVIRYLGVDISLKMIERAKLKYSDLRFTHLNPNEMKGFSTNFDYCLASGVFNLKQEKIKDSLEYLESNIKWMFNRANYGIAFNFTTNSFGDDDIVEYDSHEILKISKKLSPKIILREDYLEGDATVYIYK